MASPNAATRTRFFSFIVAAPLIVGVAGCDDAQESPEQLAPTLTPPVTATTAAPAEGDKQDAEKKNTLSDFQIGGAVKQELALDDGVPYHRINVDVQDGVVSLTGSVPNLLAHRRATDRAEMVRGVRSVVNDIEVLGDDRSEAVIYKDAIAALVSHPATESYEVDIDNTGGELILKGKVDSWAERELTETVVASVRGVTKITNELAVSYDTTRPDEEIQQEIEARLANDLWVFADRLKVAVKEGVASITGSVSSAAERRRAREVAWVAGIKQVSTEGVQVKWWEEHEMRKPMKGATSTAELDKEAEGAIKATLKVDPRTLGAAQKVNVDVEDGTATLTGDVMSFDAKLAAERDALNTVGVWRVRNLLQVRPVPVVTDEDLEKQVFAALNRNPYVEHLPLRADVENGEVTLYGQVENAFQRDQANWVAGQVVGVVNVRDAMTELPSTRPVSDFVLRSEVLHQLAWDPFVDAENVEVDVLDGVVRLSGTVKDWRAHDAAVRNAREAGARRLVDELRIKDGPALFAPQRPDR